jgi:hypothetical protein
VTQRGRYERAVWIWFVARCSRVLVGNPQHEDGEVGTKACLGMLESSIPHCREKPLSVELPAPVPQTDTGGQVENTKAIERTLAKELGKLTP